MESFSDGDLRIDVEDSEGGVRLEWRGKSTARTPALLLQPFFARVIAALVGHEGRALSVAFERLEHFNSSTISALIQLIHQCRAKRVKLLFTYDGRLKWQQLSFEALRVLAKPDGLFEVRSIG